MEWAVGTVCLILGFAGVQIGGWDHEALEQVGWSHGTWRKGGKVLHDSGFGNSGTVWREDEGRRRQDVLGPEGPIVCR